MESKDPRLLGLTQDYKVMLSPSGSGQVHSRTRGFQMQAQMASNSTSLASEFDVRAPVEAVATLQSTRSFDCVRLAPRFAQDDQGMGVKTAPES